MKKFISAFTAVIAVLAILCSNMLPALAKEKWPVRDDPQEVFTYVNGEKNDDVVESNEISPESQHYMYLGGGTVIGWEFPTLTEGVDYEILSQGEDDIEFKILNGQSCVPYINVFVDFEHWPVRSDVQDITAYTNGSRPGHVLVTYTPDSKGFRLSYTAEGNVTGWEFPSMTEGKNYEILAQKDNYIDIRLINGQDEIPDVNVLVDFSNPKKNDNDQALNKGENAGPVNGQDKNSYANAAAAGNVVNDMDDIALIYVVAGICAVAAGILIIVVVKKHKKKA